MLQKQGFFSTLFLYRTQVTLIYFSCDDCANEASRLVESGGKIHEAKTAIGEYGFIVLAFDSEGNMIGLHSMT